MQYKIFRGILLSISIFALMVYASSSMNKQTPTLDYLTGIRAVDGFEQINSPLDNWTILSTNQAYKSSLNPHTGQFSLYLNETGLNMEYKNPVTGSSIVEIMFYDSYINTAATGFAVAGGPLSVEIRIHSSVAGGNNYAIANSSLYDSGIQRSQGWHNFTVYNDKQGPNSIFTAYIDNTLVSTETGTSTDISSIAIDSGAVTPSYYWDDFSIRDPGAKSPLFYITETSTVTNTVTTTQNNTVTTTQTTTQNNTITNTVTQNNTVTNTVTTNQTITHTTNDTVTVTGNHTETFTSTLETTSTFISNITHFATTSLNVTTTNTKTTTEYQDSTTPSGPEPPSFTLSTDFLLGTGAGIALVAIVVILRRFYG